MGCIVWLGLAIVLGLSMLSGDPQDAMFRAMLFFILFVSAPVLLGGVREPQPPTEP